jgi:ligand-binding sensor domain-containing protein
MKKAIYNSILTDSKKIMQFSTIAKQSFASIIFSIILAFTFSSSSYSQKIIVYDTINSQIINNNVRTIFIDRYNAKWIGTDKGLCRFDGTTWKTYSSDDKIGNSPISDIALQYTKFYGDEIWIATSSGASVAAINIDGITSATTYSKKSFPLLSDSIIAVAVDTGGTRYLASSNGITWFKGNKWGIITSDSLSSSIPAEPILSLFARNDSLYIGTQGYGYAKGGVGRIQMTVDGITGASIIQGPYCGNLNNAVHSIFIDSKARQWFGTEGGLFEHVGEIYKGAGWLQTFTRDSGLCGDTIYAIAEGATGLIWVGTNAGLSILSKDSIFNVTVAQGLPSNEIYDIAFDTLGNAWLATSNGLANVSKDIFTSIPNFTNLSSNSYSIFPNPTKGRITISAKEENLPYKISLIDMNGRIILSKQINSSKCSINLNDCAYKGIYFVHINSQKENKIYKVVFY